MKTLGQLLAEWEEGTLTAEDAAELKELLAQPEARAELVDEWLLHEAAYGALRVEEAQPSQTAATRQAAASARPRRAVSGPALGDHWLRRWLPRLVWRDVHVSLRWSIGAVAVVCVVLAGLHFYFENALAARVAALHGTVMISRGNKEQPVKAGQLLHPGDALKVPAGAAVALSWRGEHTRVELGPKSEVRLQSQLWGKRYVLQGGHMQAAVDPQQAWRPMLVTTPQAEVRVVGTRFALEATSDATRLEVTGGAVALRKTHPASASDKTETVVEAGQYALAKPNAPIKAVSMSGCAAHEILAFPASSPLFSSTGGRVLWADLLTNLTFYAGYVRFETNPADRYEHRIRGYLRPPASGDFTFWIQSGQGSELWLSPDEDPAHAQGIASMPLKPGRRPAPAAKGGSFTWRVLPATSNAPPQFRKPIPVSANFNQQTSQKSAPQRLRAGQRYYIEVRHDYDPNDLVVVGWSRPGESRNAPTALVGGAVLSPYFETTSRARYAASR